MKQDSDTNLQKGEGQEERKQMFTRRQLLQAGWTAPVIVALEMARPKTVFAQGGGSHMDFTDHRDSWPHWDGSHLDIHIDVYTDHDDSHGDSHYDLHTDGPHYDLFSIRRQSEETHGDSHDDYHEDSPRIDVTSHEDYLDHIDS